MGTNYYLQEGKCNHCGRYDKLHIGKSSMGWRFTFRGYPDDLPPIKTLEDWTREIADKDIEDEYGRIITASDFWLLVAGKKDAHYEMHHNDWLDPRGNYFCASEFT